MHFLTSLIALASAIAVTEAAPSRRADCDCYVTDGSNPTHYKYYDYWDFRSLSQYIASPGRLSTIDANRDAPVTSSYFGTDSDFGRFWKPINRLHGDTFSNQYSPNNLYISKNDGSESATYLTMRTHRLSGFQASAEFDSTRSISYASMRMYSRAHGDTGACGAMFTYLDNTNPSLVQESDIEMLTRESTSSIHYTNQPAESDGASHQVNLPSSWTQWSKHRLDWGRGRTVFSFNGQEMYSTDFQVPKDPSTLMFNMWSNAGPWTGTMPVGGSAYQDIQYVEVLHDIVHESLCSSVCSIDVAGASLGNPVRV